MLIIIVSASFVIGILGGLIGSRAGDSNCECRKGSDAGWMGFSVVWFMGSIVAIALALVWAFKPGYVEKLLTIGKTAV